MATKKLSNSSEEKVSYAIRICGRRILKDKDQIKWHLIAIPCGITTPHNNLTTAA